MACWCKDCGTVYAPKNDDPHSCAKVARERKEVIERLHKENKELRKRVDELEAEKESVRS
jgi:predicted RNase H-like nuclease (RuvC/YqgF family)